MVLVFGGFMLFMWGMAYHTLVTIGTIIAGSLIVYAIDQTLEEFE